MPITLEELRSLPPDEYQPHSFLRVSCLIPDEASPDVWASAWAFLKEAGFQIQSETADTVVWKRGSVLGNMISFDIRKLMTEATLRRTSDGVQLEMKIKLVLQTLSVWNYIDLQAELYDFNHFARTGVHTDELRGMVRAAKGIRWYFDWRPASLFWKASPE